MNDWQWINWSKWWAPSIGWANWSLSPEFPKSKVEEYCPLFLWAYELPGGRFWVIDDNLPCLIVLTCLQNETWQVERKEGRAGVASLVPFPGPWAQEPQFSKPQVIPSCESQEIPPVYVSWSELGFCHLQQKDPWLSQVNPRSESKDLGLSERHWVRTLKNNQPKGKLRLYLTRQILPATIRPHMCPLPSAIGKVALTCYQGLGVWFKYFTQRLSPSLQQKAATNLTSHSFLQQTYIMQLLCAPQIPQGTQSEYDPVPGEVYSGLLEGVA